jgi:hypothetical protein
MIDPLWNVRLARFHGAPSFLEPVALGAESVDLIQHSIQESVGRFGRYPCPLQLLYFAALPVDLRPHPLDFAANMLNVRHGP